jgi:SAM-dependent methyltransferase
LWITERILEYPFVYRTLGNRERLKNLEFGCANSQLSLELAALGHNQVGVDLRYYPFQHPNLRFYQGDFFDVTFDEAPFDVIIAISAIEHVGLGWYGEKIRPEKSDADLIDAFVKILKPEGQLIITVPFGVKKITPSYRIYDRSSLLGILKRFDIEDEEYYYRQNKSIWLPCSHIYLEATDWDPQGNGAEGVALISARLV